MNKRFLLTVVLSSLLPVLAACVIIYRTSLNSAQRAIIGSLTLEAEYKAKEIHGYLSLKKQTQAILSELGMFSVAVEYQRFEGLTLFFNSMMKNERGYAGVCFLDKALRIQACNEVSGDGKYLVNNRAELAGYLSGLDFKSRQPWQFVKTGAGLTPVVISRVVSEGKGHIGYLAVLLNRTALDELLAAFSEKYERINGVPLQYLAAVKIGESYVTLNHSPGFVQPSPFSEAGKDGQADSGGLLSVWNTYEEAGGVRTFFQAKSSALFSRLRLLRVLFWVVVPLFLAGVAVLIVYVAKTSFRSIELLLGKMEELSKGNYSRIEQGRLPHDKYINYANSLIDRLLEYKEAVQLAAVGKQAAQVAHDIRSPLAALDAALKNTPQLPESKRVMLRHAVNRIRDIANNLLEKTRQQAKPSAGGPESPLELYLLSCILDPVVTEKRLQFESRPGVHIDLELTPESYGLFARIQPVEFKRMLSNLVNNAVEALGESGSVNVGLLHLDGSVLLTVSDNGKGIPPEILPKLGQRGETHGKPGGSGLGLFHAKTTAENWGGSLAIVSEEGKGTTVTISLPRAAAPDGFEPELRLYPGRPVVVLDDDETIHQVWQSRLEAERAGEQGIEVLHFSEPGTLRAWIGKEPAKAGSAVYLFDYELLGCRETGLSLAQELGIAARVVLVTSRYDERPIAEEARRLKIRMIPKSLAGLAPISIKARPKTAPAVLIDDDSLVRLNWTLAAQSAGVSLKTFSEPAEFLAGLAAFPENTPIYIDAELGGGIKGDNIAEELRKKGFTEICLATGHPPENFSHVPWLKVIGKNPPWSDPD
ncbi:MAG TPA: hypothetical protein DCW72_10575 [Elusimicrobia bacterium]|nr:MAG: hypothetical protein A2X29_12615 [Elusimicrobia bacterium GWA2_64_40]HAN04234.1 hypothetical protein [Elusimicrobiota bacterium]HAU90624.1 hypothetical protein [Elusimicrobiota bacterium]